jgi:hypothetical protein
MTSPAAVPLPLITVPPTENQSKMIDSQETCSWEIEEAEESDDTKIPSSNDISSEDASLIDDISPEEDFGAPLSQHPPSLQWEEPTFLIEEEEEEEGEDEEEEEEEDCTRHPVPEPESEDPTWEDEEDAPSEEEEEDAAVQEKKEQKLANAELLPLSEITGKFLSRLVKEAFSGSMFKDTAPENAAQDAENGAFFQDPKRQRKSSAASFPRLQLKRHICSGSPSDGSASCSPDMNPACNFTHKVNSTHGQHVQMTCAQCKKLITTLVSRLFFIFYFLLFLLF